MSEEGIESVSGGCGPVALTFNVAENGYELSEYWEPGDGSQYSDDIRKKFPEDILDEVWNPQDYVDATTVSLLKIRQKYIIKAISVMCCGKA